jgi:hypothetical protein
MKKLIKEQDLYQTSQTNQFEEIDDQFLKTAAASGCFKQGFTPNVKDPELGIDAVEQKDTHKTTGQLISIFHTNKKSIKNPGRTLSYMYSGMSPNYEYLGTLAYKCKQLEERTNPDFLSGVGKELYNVLTTPIANDGLGYKGYGDVKGTDIQKYRLVDIKNDPDLQPGGRFYDKVVGFPQFFDTIKNQDFKLLLWKPALASAPVLDIQKKQASVYEYYKNRGFTPCAKGEYNEQEIAAIDLSIEYHQSFKPGTRVCKKFEDMSTNKQDCRGIIDSYMDEIEKYNNVGVTIKPNSDFLNTIKPSVKVCIRKNLGKMPLRNKEMKFFQSLRASSPFFLGNIGESTDNLTSIIRESLRIVKKRKNSY